MAYEEDNLNGNLDLEDDFPVRRTSEKPSSLHSLTSLSKLQPEIALERAFRNRRGRDVEDALEQEAPSVRFLPLLLR